MSTPAMCRRLRRAASSSLALFSAARSASTALGSLSV